MSSKATTKRPEVKRVEDLADLIGTRRVVDVASHARVGAATVYRALKGYVPHTPQLLALSAALGVSEETCRAAIERSREGGAA